MGGQEGTFTPHLNPPPSRGRKLMGSLRATGKSVNSIESLCPPLNPSRERGEKGTHKNKFDKTLELLHSIQDDKTKRVG